MNSDGLSGYADGQTSMLSHPKYSFHPKLGAIKTA